MILAAERLGVNLKGVCRSPGRGKNKQVEKEERPVAEAEAADRDHFSFDAEHQSGRQVGSSKLASGASLGKAKLLVCASSRFRASLSFASGRCAYWPGSG